jgi:hypothetical protein
MRVLIVGAVVLFGLLYLGVAWVDDRQTWATFRSYAHASPIRGRAREVGDTG